MAEISEIRIGDTLYDIKDKTARQSGGTAARTEYTNTTSGLEATNVQDAIDEVVAQKGSSNGIAELNNSGKVPASQLPSYVDDVINGYYNNGHFYEEDTYETEITGAVGYIYYDIATTKQYRWNDTTFIEIINSGGCTASDVSYSNVNSGLAATDVQRAIDELNTKIYDAGNYETVSLTIGSADSTFSPVGQTITVTLEDGSSTDYVLTNSLVISFVVQKGMKYTISGTSTEDYRVLPLSVKAVIPTRYLTMRYIPIATGVFILQSDGNYYLRQEYDAETMAEDAVGVLVLTSALIEAGFGLVIGKNDSNKSISIPTSTIILGTTNYNGYVGKQNTYDINAAYPTQFPPINQSTEYTIQCNGDTLRGYTASVAEGLLLIANSQDINDALLQIGATLLPNASTAWTSSYIYQQYLRSLKTWNNNAIAYQSNNSGVLRPIYQFPLT